MIEHTLLCNEAYLYFNCPLDWKTEYTIEIQERVSTLDLKVRGLSISNKKRIVSDAVFTRNGYIHLIEIDNTGGIGDNKTKIESYVEAFAAVKDKTGLIPALYVFTTNENRKRKFIEWMQKQNLRIS